MSDKILLAEDDASLRFVLSQALTKEGYAVRATGSLATLVKWVKEREGDAVVSDVYLGEDCVFDVLPNLRTQRPELPIIVMSAQSTITTAMSAAGGGACEYLPKPFDLDDLSAAVKRALSGTNESAKARATLKEAEREERLPLIGRSAAMQEVYRVVSRAAQTDLPVLIEGEPGSGKERAARAIHGFSRRRTGPFVTLHLGAHAGGLNADAVARAHAEAQGGVLYIDGLDGLEHQDQARLRGALAALLPEGAQEVRLIGATQRPLPALTQEGGFRRDLLDAFNVIAIRMPPLRERPADIADLAHAFLVRARREGLSQCTLDAGAIEALKQHAWPGNVRELENLLRRIAALWPEPVITAAKIDQELSAPRISAPAAPAGQAESLDAAIAQHVADTFAAARGSPPEGLYDQMLERLERPLIAETLKATRGNQIKAAAVLGINRNTLRKKIAALGLLTGRGD